MLNLATAESTKETSRTRFFKRYENVVDDLGFNPTAYKPVELFFRILYQKWFGVQVAGINNIPATGSAILFGNHSGVLPIDACLLYDGIINFHANPRRLRFLATKFLMKTPVIGDILRAYGCITPDYETSTELLHNQELVLFYPEAEKGTGKLYKDRYKLAGFHSGFVRAAIETGSPLVPVVTIGGDEIYPLLANCKPLAKLIKAPYFPVTPFFPWLPFPLNVIPLPIKIMICVWRPFKLRYPPEAAKDEALVDAITNDIRADLQAKVDGLLAIRTGLFKKWNMDKVNAYLENTSSYSPTMQKHRNQSWS